MQFISQYSPEDIVTAQIEGSSGALWRISPPSRAQMKRELYNGSADITLRFTWNFQRCVPGQEGPGLGLGGTPVGVTPRAVVGTWPRAARWSTPTRSTPWAWPPTAPPGGSWPACWRAPQTSPCEWGLGAGGLHKGWAGPDLPASSHRVIPHLFPKYIRAPNGPEANPVKQLQPSEWGGGARAGVPAVASAPDRAVA